MEFVGSVYGSADRCDWVGGSLEYGVTGSAAVAQEKVFAAQFHPEKSHDNGVKLLANFLDWDGRC